MSEIYALYVQDLDIEPFYRLNLQNVGLND